MARKLFVWVEGGSDARFVEAVLKPLLEKKYRRVDVRTYATLKKSKVINILRGIREGGNDYLLVADNDQQACVTAKKQIIQERFPNVDRDRIRVVVQEIESWYLAGLDGAGLSALGLPDIGRTDNITKEDFNVLIPERFDSRIDFMMEILKFFSIRVAERKNRSFAYFMSKQGLDAEILPQAGETEATKHSEEQRHEGQQR